MSVSSTTCDRCSRPNLSVEFHIRSRQAVFKNELFKSVRLREDCMRGHLKQSMVVDVIIFKTVIRMRSLSVHRIATIFGSRS